MTDQNPPKLDIDWIRTTAGALAAVSTAVLLSTLGAAGTIIGAAVGSIAATVTTALYSQGLARSRAKVVAVQAQALQKVGIAQSEVRRAGRRPGSSQAHLDHAEEQLAEAKDGLDELQDAPEPTAWRQLLAGLPWKRIALLSAGLFLVVVVAISLFEALSGKPVSSYTGGSDKDGRTSISRLTGSDRDDSTEEREKPAPTRESSTPSDDATPRESSTPTEDPTPTTGVPSPSPTDGATPSEGSTMETEEAEPIPDPKATVRTPEPRASVPAPSGSATP